LGGGVSVVSDVIIKPHGFGFGGVGGGGGGTVELHVSGLIGTASHPDMQKIRIIGFFFENRLH